jgi:hypothetical protein
VLLQPFQLLDPVFAAHRAAGDQGDERSAAVMDGCGGVDPALQSIAERTRSAFQLKG